MTTFYLRYRFRLMLLMVALITTGVTAVLAAEGDYGDDYNGDSDAPVADNSETAAVESLGPYGGDLWDMALDSTNDYIYAVAKDSPNGFYRSADSGLTWEGMTGMDVGGGMAVEVDPTTGDVYAVFSRGLYQSTDNGVTLTKIQEVSGSALLYAQDQLMMSTDSTPGSILISTDNGVSFSTNTVASDISLWWIDASATAGTFYTLGYDDSYLAQVYKSIDGGSIWTELTIPELTDTAAGSRICSNPTDPTNLILTGGYSGTAYYSVDSGSNWIAATVQSQSCVFDATGRVYVGEQYSDDKGVTWSSVGQDDSTSTGLGGHNITIDPNNVNIIYVDALPGLGKSVDRGTTWTDINEGIAAVTITDISQAADKAIVWAAAYNGIVKSTNFTDATPTWEFALADPGTGIWVEPVAAQIILVGEIGAIKRSTDSGSTWTSVAEEHLSHDYSVNEIIQDRTNSDVLYAAVVNGEPNNTKTGKMLKSEDLGVTWTDMEILDDASAQSVSQASTGDLYVGVGAEAGSTYKKGIYKYSAGSWEQLANAPDEEVIKVIIDPEDDNIIYAVASIAYGNGDTTNFGFYKSEDAGGTWSKITSGLSENREYKSLAVQTSTNPNTLYLGASNYYGQGVLYKSSDAGATWGTFYTGLQDETFYTLFFDGITAGTSRGLFNLKSKAALVVKAAKNKVPVMKKAELTVTLKDVVTNKKLKNQTVKLFQKKNGSFELVDNLTTNKKGKATMEVRLRQAKKYTFKARWTAKGNYSDEYTSAQSATVNVTAKK